jgi:hypothetical protein
VKLNASKLDELETFLRTQGIVCEQLDRDGWSRVVGQWVSIFGNAFGDGRRYGAARVGVKAQYALSQVGEGEFLLFPLPSKLPFWRTSKRCPNWAYRCKASAIPALDQFCNLDFVMAASDFSWTMVYTHEDFTLGGPYFIEKASVEQQSGEQGTKNRKRRRRRYRF